ncbi:hypothetical protein [Paenibacillus kribbensis]|uniref:hypothetical protein n=1 Tax=Paenibacillus kribbensis TaxID=172713 RepID=UPI0015C08F97|nr:hypothetical protein [Paenibacillus kribbensis]
MKKKILIGMLTIVACLSFSSASFASNDSTSLSNKTSKITPNADYSGVINLKVGQRTWATGYSFQIVSTNGAVILEPENDWSFYALRPGITVIKADFGNGNWMHYSVIVS